MLATRVSTLPTVDLFLARKGDLSQNWSTALKRATVRGGVMRRYFDEAGFSKHILIAVRKRNFLDLSKKPPKILGWSFIATNKNTVCQMIGNQRRKRPVCAFFVSPDARGNGIAKIAYKYWISKIKKNHKPIFAAYPFKYTESFFYHMGHPKKLIK